MKSSKIEKNKKKNNVSFAVVINGKTLANGYIAESADLDKFVKSVLYMAVVANMKAYGKEGVAMRELYKMNPGMRFALNKFWKALDKMDL